MRLFLQHRGVASNLSCASSCVDRTWCRCPPYAGSRGIIAVVTEADNSALYHHPPPVTDVTCVLGVCLHFRSRIRGPTEKRDRSCDLRRDTLDNDLHTHTCVCFAGPWKSLDPGAALIVRTHEHQDLNGLHVKYTEQPRASRQLDRLSSVLCLPVCSLLKPTAHRGRQHVADAVEIRVPTYIHTGSQLTQRLACADRISRVKRSSTCTYSSILYIAISRVRIVVWIQVLGNPYGYRWSITADCVKIERGQSLQESA